MISIQYNKPNYIEGLEAWELERESVQKLEEEGENVGIFARNTVNWMIWLC